MSVPVVPIYSSSDFPEHVRRAAELLNSGKLVVLPTETVYGVAGLLTRPAALAAMRTLRGGSSAEPMTIHVPTAEAAEGYLDTVTELAGRMMKKLWPGPVGLVFDVSPARRREVASSLGLPESELFDRDGTITLRCPDDLVTQQVLEDAAGPVALTVAGSGSSSPHHSPAATLAQELSGKVELVLDAGPTRYHQPSTIVKVGSDGYRIVRKGVYDERIIDRLLRTTILFVCSGNTCRSPMAEAITRHLLAEANGVSDNDLEKKGLSVLSAGAYAMPGARATPQGVDAVKAIGADLSTHRSRQLTPELIHQADVIFTMGRGHVLAVTTMVPSAKQKVATLDPAGDIEDPIGGDAELYRDLAGSLQRLIESRLKERDLLATSV